MTQIDRIRRIIREIEEGSLFDISEIRDRTDIPQASIRRILGMLSKTSEISRVEPGLFRVSKREDTTRFGGQVVDFRRKFVSGLFYCSGRKRQFFAVTFEIDNISRESELIGFLEDEIASDCSELRENHGYSDEPGFSSEESIPRYPEITGGEL